MGQAVLIRFELINDDAINQDGLAVDKVRLMDGESVLFTETFTTTSPCRVVGKRTVGSSPITACPSLCGYMFIQQTASGFHVTRWNVTQNESVTFRLLADVEAVTFSVSPYAPFTTIPLGLRVSVHAIAYNM
ncbi:MAG UNVERIFIED_CONTAM: hypothetical protein LVT10_02655 [Anaerolineae bacterium]